MNASIIFVVKHHNVFLYFALQSIVVLLIYILLFFVLYFHLFATSARHRWTTTVLCRFVGNAIVCVSCML